MIFIEMKYLFPATIMKYNMEYKIKNFLSAAGWCRKSQGCKLLNHKFSRFANNGEHRRGVGKNQVWVGWGLGRWTLDTLVLVRLSLTCKNMMTDDCRFLKMFNYLNCLHLK
jgi:hypothetical protein